MQFNQGDTLLWYGTPDAPAPGPELQAVGGRVTGITLTVGVRPVGSRNAVEVRYRVNGGPGARIQTSLARTDIQANTQYFVAALPEFRVGDVVDYIAVLSSPGLQVPAGATATTFASSFRVVDPGASIPNPGGSTTTAAAPVSPPPPVAEEAASHPSAPGSAMALAAPTLAAQKEIQDELSKHTGSMEEFWRTLALKPGFQSPQKIASLQFALQLGHLTQGQPAMAEAIHRIGKYQSMRDLALATEELPEHVKAVPADQLAQMSGDTVEQKRLAYAHHLQSVLQAAFPTEAVAAHLEKIAAPAADKSRFKATADFLKRASTPATFPSGTHFDIATTHVERFCEMHKDVLFAGVSDQDRRKTIAEVKRAQRLFRVSTSPQPMSALMAHGLGSAQAIAHMPEKSFVAQLAGKVGGAEAARLIHQRATATSTANAQLAVQVRHAASNVHPGVTGGGIKELPTWAQMFGDADMCDCEEFASVCGPGAYLVDLLQYLGNSRPDSAGLLPLEHLIGKDDEQGRAIVTGRRPDLACLPLTLENTEVTIPYVDLVNEVLESYVVRGKPDRAAAHDVGERTSAQLLASPQFIEQVAYDALKTACFPPSLPFDRSLEAIRLQLAQLQTSRLEVMRAFAIDDQARWSPALVAEALQISAREYEILTGRRIDGTDAGIDVKSLYGFVVSDPPMSLGQQLKPVRLFLAASAVSYIELIDLLKCRSVNPTQKQLRLIEVLGLTSAEIEALVTTHFASVPASVQAKLGAANHTAVDLRQWLTVLDAHIELVSTGAECDLDGTSLQRRDGGPLDEAALLNLHRFVRLWRKLGLAPTELDAVLVSRRFVADPVSGLRDLAQIVELASRTGMAPSQITVLWSAIDSFGKASAYRRLFENPALVHEPDPAFRLNPAEEEIDNATRGQPDFLLAKATTIAAALRVRAQDVEAIASDANLSATAPLTLANISVLYRYALLARGLGLPLRLLIEIRKLAAFDANPFKDPAGTLRFAAIAAEIRDSGISAAQLAFWCRHDDPGRLLTAAVETSLSALTSKLSDGVSKSRDERATLLGQPTAEQLQSKLTQVIGAGDLMTAVAIVEGNSKLSQAEQRAYITGPGRFAVFMDAQEAVTILESPLSNDPLVREEQTATRRVTVLRPLLAYLDRQFVRQTVADSLGLRDPKLTDHLLDRVSILSAPDAPAKSMLDAFTVASNTVAPANSADDRSRDAYTRLWKAAAVVSQWNLTADELEHLASHAADFDGFDLNRLPVRGDDGKGVFAYLRTLVEYAAMRDGPARGPIPLIQCLAAPDDASRVTALATLLDVKGDRVRDAIVQLGLSARSLARPAGLKSLVSLLALASSTGAAPAQLRGWVAAPTRELADSTRQALKARFDEASWLAVARSISDTLRDRQRASLVAFLLTAPGIKSAGVQTADQLYEYFLIDVQMDPCMLTSRIKQAISSVQLFIERCFLNLERDIRPDAIDASQWEWRKNYRVWEANRKVFLHPESLLEPELRDDKSQFFREAESDLLQSDCSDAAAERVFRTYVAKVDNIARLETCGLFQENSTSLPGHSVLHVVARTQSGAPRRYHYRQWIDNATWSAWEKLDLDIDAQEDGDNTGVHLLPFVWKDHSFLFWLTFTRKIDKPPVGSYKPGDPISPQQSSEYWEIKLAWSQRENGRWGPKRLSTNAYEYPPLVAVPAPAPSRPTPGVGAPMLVDPRATVLVRGTGDMTVGNFLLRAVDAGDSLEVYVMQSGAFSNGCFTLHDRHGDFRQTNTRWTAKTNLIQSASPHFMAERTDRELVLSGPDGTGKGAVALLGKASHGYRVVPTAQTKQPPLTMPAIIETIDATYFTALRLDLTSLIELMAHAHRVHPVVQVPALDLQGLLHLSASAAHPRIQTGSAAGPKLRQHAATRGTGSTGVHGLLVISPRPHVSPIRARFETAFHPHASEFVRRMNVQGVSGLLSFDTQTLGNPYFENPWNPGSVLTKSAAGGACLIEGGVGRDPAISRPGNFEAVVLEGSHLVHYWHDSSDVGKPWERAGTIENNAVGPGCICERVSARVLAGGGASSKVLKRGTLEVVVSRSDGLAHYSWPSNNPAHWIYHGIISTQAVSAGCLVETDYLSDGKRSLDLLVLEKVAETEGLQLAHYRLDNSLHLASGSSPVPTPIHTGGGQLLATASHLSAAPVSSAMAHVATAAHLSAAGRATAVRRGPLLIDLTKLKFQEAWQRLGIVAEDVVGAACLIQSSFVERGHGTLEALVLERSPDSLTARRIVHYWKDETAVQWQRGAVVSDAATGPAWMIQGRVQDSSRHGNFEAVIQEGTQLVHYWRDNSLATRPWHRGRVISASAGGPGCIAESHFGPTGNFEVVVPEGIPADNAATLTLQHYWHSNEAFHFLPTLAPNPDCVDDPLPRHDVDFSYGSPYSQYNWELFFHLPLFIATRLMHSKRYADARRWFHRIFNPTDDSNELTTHRFWKFLPFRDEGHEHLERVLGAWGHPNTQDSAETDELRRQIKDWQANPFMPHRIARMRPDAYKRNVLMKYVDNLVAWGDELFRQDTIESINEATQLFVMAANLFGRRPERVPRRKRPAKTYADLRAAGIDDLGDAAIGLENEFPPVAVPGPAARPELAAVVGVTSVPYFCIPNNEKLLGYWDTIEDRLYKIRHCMNIAGVVRQLPLFEPPIDPALLVSAVAEGIPLGAAAAALNAPLPYYRFTPTLHRALEVCNDVRSLEAELLSALEKRDAEVLAKTRARHETSVLTLVKIVKEQQKREAEAARDGLLANRATAVARWQHYQELLGQPTDPPPEPQIQSEVSDGKYKVTQTLTAAKEYVPSGRFQLVDASSIDMGLSVGTPVGDISIASIHEDISSGTQLLSFEKEELVSSLQGTVAAAAASAIEGLGSILNMIPNFSLNVEPFGVGSSISFGGSNFGAMYSALARVQNIGALIANHDAARAAKLGSVVLREREWALQNKQAAKEIGYIDQQIVAAKVRIDVAEQDRRNQGEQIGYAREIEEFLRKKFTNDDLYCWLQQQLLDLYRNAYQLAFDLARQAEQCYRFDLGVTDTGFIQMAGYWSGGQEGLLAGERLQLALRQMEKAYYDQNAREYELTKHVSIVALDPLQLVTLKETGTCQIELPESLFDLDFPGHYMRRLRSVSVTVPCVAGPYTGISCTLRLLDSTIRYKSIAGSQYARSDENDERFIVQRAATSAIATNTGQNDAGMFDFNFRDERYLPFEGAGAISRWELELNAAFPQFDCQSITDVILHLRYTAREGGARLKAAAVKSMRDAFKSPGGMPLLATPDGLPLMRLLSLRHEFPAQWHKLTLSPRGNEDALVERSVALPVNKERFPYFVKGATLQPQSIAVIATPRGTSSLATFGLTIRTDAADPSPAELSLQPVKNRFGDALFAQTDAGAVFARIESDAARLWELGIGVSASQMHMISENLGDLFLVVTYTATFPP